MSEIDPTDDKSISARLFPDEGYREAVREMVKSERDNKRVEAEFLVLRQVEWLRLWTEQMPLSCASCLVPGSGKYEGLLGKGLGLSGKACSDDIVICCIASCSMTRRSSPLLCCGTAACKEIVSLVQKAFLDSCNLYLVLYEVNEIPGTELIECSLRFGLNFRGLHSLFIGVQWLQPDFWIDSNLLRPCDISKYMCCQDWEVYFNSKINEQTSNKTRHVR